MDHSGGVLEERRAGRGDAAAMDGTIWPDRVFEACQGAKSGWSRVSTAPVSQLTAPPRVSARSRGHGAAGDCTPETAVPIPTTRRPSHAAGTAGTPSPI